MKPEHNSRRIYGITRSMGKMYELNVPKELHINVPVGSEPEKLFPLTIGTLGDAASTINNALSVPQAMSQIADGEIGFSASFLDAFVASQFNLDIADEVMLLASAGYYLARRPGSSLVLARLLDITEGSNPLKQLLLWLLRAEWASPPKKNNQSTNSTPIEQVIDDVFEHFRNGSDILELSAKLEMLRLHAYKVANSEDLLLVDLIIAVIKIRLYSSSWITLPEFTNLSLNQWRSIIQRSEFPKELWPSQLLLGDAGLFAGASGVVQMPTSAGKTKSVEIILRSGFLSGRTKLAVVVAPFRALCHEISASLRYSFREDDVKVNELSDVIQLDFVEQVADLLGSDLPSTSYILVVTPEKLLYMLRQVPNLLNSIGIVVYDEGHQFDTGTRGITYELLLTEIKSLLPTSAQTILVSAVIQNANAVGQWLIGENAKVIAGQGLLATARSVAFSSWIENLGQLLFYESEDYAQYDYFVPRVIEQQELKKFKSETKKRVFPEKNNSSDISLYLGLRLVGQGAVAIFCGNKKTASSILTRAVEIYSRGLSIESPDKFSNADELRRLVNIYTAHFGDSAAASHAASLGIFAHHGNTPHGIRLAVEYAMQKGKIRFVACTSTLAQGVNLPIRYLIVSGIYQGSEKLKIRDFQNLIGRAGRAGMHTEGLIIFADTNVYDKRFAEDWRFRSAVDLLTPAFAGDTTTSLLSILAPIISTTGKQLSISASNLCGILYQRTWNWRSWAQELIRLNPHSGFNEKAVVSELKYRRNLLFAVESYLMANRGDSSFPEFKEKVQKLTASTLAYHLAESEEIKFSLVEIFSRIAEHIEATEPTAQKQASYAKTLLGVESSIQIEQWVFLHREALLSLESNVDWISFIWPLFSAQLDDKFVHDVEPQTLPQELATLWISGEPYFKLFDLVKNTRGTRPWGKSPRRAIQDDAVISFCESTLGFDCSLIVAAVIHFLFETVNQDDRARSALLFQKSFKYGLPDWLSITCYERGFSDRMLSQQLSAGVQANGFVDTSFGKAVRPHREVIEKILFDYPSYFSSLVEDQ